MQHETFPDPLVKKRIPGLSFLTTTRLKFIYELHELYLQC